MMIPLSSGDLAHHGIKGQKWGIRRFQNKDGSLTPAGKKRYSDDSAEEPKPKKPSVKDMSDDELRKAVNRLQMEEQYRNYTTPKPKSKPVQEAIKRALIDSGASAVRTIATAAFTAAGKAAVKKIVKDDTYKAMFPKDKDKKKDDEEEE